MNRQSSPQTRLLAKLGLAIVFLAVLAGAAVWVIRSFLPTAPTTITLSAQDTAALTQSSPANRRMAANPPDPGAGGAPVFTGKVIDAKTQQPIPRFQIRVGYAFGAGQPPNFLNQPMYFNGGTYRLTSPYSSNPQMQLSLRAEARGYLPVLSPVLKKSGSQDFALVPGPNIDGLVLAPDGTPGAGATVIMSLVDLRYTSSIDTQKSTQANRGGIQTVSDSVGRFSFFPQRGVVTLVAFNDRGFAELSQDAAAKDWTIHLAPWAQIQGQLTIAGKPAAQQTVQANSVLSGAPYVPMIFKFCSTQTDINGHFLLSRVAPGTQQIGRSYKQTVGRSANVYSTQTVNRTLLAGQTITVNLGGMGRPVIGRLVLPPGAGSLSSYGINQSINGTEEPLPPPQMPEKIKSGSAGARGLWMNLFRLTPAGRQYVADHPEANPEPHSYVMEISPGGRFRIEDVIPGTYDVSLYLFSNRGNRNLSLPQTGFTTPPVPQGYSDEPLDIGDMKLTQF